MAFKEEEEKLVLVKQQKHLMVFSGKYYHEKPHLNEQNNLATTVS